MFFTETSDYFSKIIWSSYRPCSQISQLCVTYVEWFVHQLWHITVFLRFNFVPNAIEYHNIMQYELMNFIYNCGQLVFVK